VTGLQPGAIFKFNKDDYSYINVTQGNGTLSLQGVYSDVKNYFKTNVQVHF
jgi:hypothetical protein